MDYKVIWDDQVLEELAQAVRYIAQHNPHAGQETGELILQKVGMFGALPLLGKAFHKLGCNGVREIPIPPCPIIYHVKDFERGVSILKVWHGARREPEIQ